MYRRLARFQGGALALRPTTSWTKPTMGGRIKAGFTGLKRRAKNLLARPGVRSAMNRVGTKAGKTAGWVKRKTGFSRFRHDQFAEFQRLRGSTTHGLKRIRRGD